MPPDLTSAARSLIEEAKQHEFGLDFLADGFPESVAVIHGVHADVVHTARELLANAGHGRHHVPEESPPFGTTLPPRHPGVPPARRGED